MQVMAFRDAVHASDEPEPLSFEIDDATSPQDVLRRAADRKWLPSIQGGRATWSITSNEVLAVLAYEWADLKFMAFLAEKMQRADRQGHRLQLYFNYHTQIDPEIVYRVLWGLRLRA